MNHYSNPEPHRPTTAGRRDRQNGIAANLAAATAPHRAFKDYAQDALGELIASGEPFCADDVRARIPRTVEPHSPNVLPSLFGSYAAQNIIQPVGYIVSRRRSRHSSRNRMWVAA